MFGDTLNLTIDETPVSLVKINQDGYSSEYLFRDSEEVIRARIRHTTTRNGGGAGSRDRHNVEVVRTTFETSTNPERIEKAYFVMENSPSESSSGLMVALASWAAATSGSNLVKLENWES